MIGDRVPAEVTRLRKDQVLKSYGTYFRKSLLNLIINDEDICSLLSHSDEAIY